MASSTQIAEQVLRRKGRPMKVLDIADAVVKSPESRLTGRTPMATVMSQLYVEAKKANGRFVKTKPGMMALRTR
jgi:hypothetical protein